MDDECLLDALCSILTQPSSGEVFRKDMLYWMGCVYRYWHFYIDESGLKIIRIAPIDTIKLNYRMFHIMDPRPAVEKLKDLDSQG